MMMYENCREWLKLNMQDAKRIINTRLKGDEKEEVQDAFAWLMSEVESNHKIMKWMEDAYKEVCNEEQVEAIQKLIMIYMHNDLLQTPFGKELQKAGLKPLGFKIVIEDEKE